MSNKKSLLTESEIRRFMTLANIPAVGSLNEDDREEARRKNLGDPRRKDAPAQEEESLTKEEYEFEEGIGEGGMPPYEEEEGSSYGDEMEINLKEEEEEEEGAEEEGMEDAGEEEGEDMGGEGGAGLSPEAIDHLKAFIQEVTGQEVDIQSDEGGGAEEEEMPMPPEGEEGDMPAPEEEEGTSPVMQESLVNTVLARVSARLIAEAKKAGKKKKMTPAEKLKAMKKEKEEKEKAKKKKALDEANAPAPKSHMSNASKAGVAKGHGPGKKEFGVSGVKGHKWSAGKNSGGDKMEAETASAEHIVSHGKKNLATQGGNKKK